MKKKPYLHHVTDFFMVVMLLILMAYSVTGQMVHEWLGLGLFALLILHHLLNFQWLRAMGKGRYPAARILQTALVLFLLLSMIAQIVSGIAMSRHALPFLRVPVPTSTARLLHLSFGYWSFLLVSLHLGIHWGTLLALGRKLRGGTPLSGRSRIVLRFVAGASAAYGALCFVRQNIVDYLFLKTEFVFFDYEKPPILVLGELLAIMALWVLIGYLLWLGAKKFGSKRKQQK